MLQLCLVAVVLPEPLALSTCGGREPITQHGLSVAPVLPPQLAFPWHHSVTTTKGRINTWLGCTLTAQDKTQCRPKDSVRATNHLTADQKKFMRG